MNIGINADALADALQAPGELDHPLHTPDTPEEHEAALSEAEDATPVPVSDEEREAIARDALVGTLQALYPHMDATKLNAAANELMVNATLRAHAMTHREQSQLFVAKVAHEVNRAYCQALGDTSQLPWDEAPAWQQESALAGVRLHWNNASSTPADSHAAWMAQKLSEGWTWGPVKLPDQKRHPCIQPFEALPVEQQAKDHIFRAVVLALSFGDA